MLTYLHIKDLAIIDETTVEWGEGFNVLTGETGAGKSIIVNAVALVRGEKASQDLIRSGRDRAIIEAIFSVDREEVNEVLGELGIEHEGEIILRRVIARGKNKVFINDTPVTLSTLQRIAPFLIGIEGQHSQQLLLQPRFYLVILDQFAGLEGEVRKFSSLYDEYVKLKEDIRRLREAEKERNKKLEFIRFQIEEIDRINPRPGEDEELENEKKILSRSENLRAELSELVTTLYHSDNGVVDTLRRIGRVTEGNVELGEKWEKLHSAISEALYQLEDAVFLAEDLLNSVEHDPGRLEEVTERLLELGELKRKYGPTIDDVLSEREKLLMEMKQLEELEVSLADKEARMEALSRDLERMASELSAKRKEFAARLEKKVERELSYLEMEKAKFRIEITKGELGPTGWDRVNILISPNPGEPPKPLQKIASGGELSRIMLAIRVALGERNPPSTIVFDEIDAGIGGETAESVGRKLKELARRSQLIVITHLPQIALYANKHFKVEKKVEGGRTISTIKEVKGDDRIYEIARMLGKSDKKTIEYARELLKSAGEG